MPLNTLLRRAFVYTPPGDGAHAFAITPSPSPQESEDTPQALTASLEDNLRALSTRFHAPQNRDFVMRRFAIGTAACALVFLEGMSDRQAVGMLTMSGLLSESQLGELEPEAMLDAACAHGIRAGEVKIEAQLDALESAVLSGQAVFCIEGAARALIVDVRGFEKRAIGTPQNESVIEGSQEGFTEDLRTTITQIRRLVRAGALVTEFIPVGSRAPLNCALMYLADVANPSIIEEARRRLACIDDDHTPGVGFIQQFIEDAPDSWIPQTVQTERPDRAAAFLLEGQVLMACDGAPKVLAAPTTFWNILHTSDINYMRRPLGSFEMALRMVGIVVSLCLPAGYLALVLHHPETIPSEMLMTILTTHLQVPFASTTELLLMLLAYDLILEAGTRVPGVLGSTISIVGALILGQAAVSAKLVSSVLITIVATTGLGSFCVPDYQTGIAIRMYRYVLIVFAAAWGLIGIWTALLLGVGYLASLSSFGVPLLSPIVPRNDDGGDALFHSPVTQGTHRPAYLYPLRQRKRKGRKP